MHVSINSDERARRVDEEATDELLGEYFDFFLKLMNLMVSEVG